MQFLEDGETYVWSYENCGYLGQGREAKASRHTIPPKHTFPCIHVFYTFLQHWSHLQDVKWPFEKGINGSDFHLSMCPEPTALTIYQYSTSRVQFLCLNPGNASLIQENQDVVIIVCLSALFTKELLGKRTEKNHDGTCPKRNQSLFAFCPWSLSFVLNLKESLNKWLRGLFNISKWIQAARLSHHISV